MDCIEYITAFYPDDPSLGFDSGGTHEPVGEIVRCRDCAGASHFRDGDIWCRRHRMWTEADGYCAWGERGESK